jgi:hypothetical protein
VSQTTSTTVTPECYIVVIVPSSKYNLHEVENAVPPICSSSKRFVYSPWTKGKIGHEEYLKDTLFTKFDSLTAEPIFGWLSSCIIKRRLLMHYESLGVDNLNSNLIGLRLKHEVCLHQYLLILVY